MIKKLTLIAYGALMMFSASAQDSTNNLLNDLKKDDSKETNYATHAFKSTRVVTAQSIENMPAGVLDLRFAHRFEALHQGISTLFGLDHAIMRIGFEYGITNRLMAGVGRSSGGPEYDGFIKYKILRQSTGARNMPFSLSFVSTVVANTIHYIDDTRNNREFHNRFYYTQELLIARKFSEALTLQLTPTWTHATFPYPASLPNNLLAAGIGGRLKLTKRMSLNAEYFYQFPDYKYPGTKDPVSVGLEIETGGHVFSLMVSNSQYMNDKTYITETPGKNDLHFGFNLSRVFTLKKPKGTEDAKKW